MYLITAMLAFETNDPVGWRQRCQYCRYTDIVYASINGNGIYTSHSKMPFENEVTITQAKERNKLLRTDICR